MPVKEHDTASQIVILGYTGFIGKALSHYLRVHGDTPVIGFASSSLDLRCPAALDTLATVLDSQTTLVFAAAQTLDRMEDCLDIFDANMAMALNVARLLATHPVRKCVYFSTVSVYVESGAARGHARGPGHLLRRCQIRWRVYTAPGGAYCRLPIAHPAAVSC
jgi:nucleoside-diphosphate-sugar epimerase